MADQSAGIDTADTADSLNFYIITPTLVGARWKNKMALFRYLGRHSNVSVIIENEYEEIANI